jgi:hypothetical protein
VGRQRVDEEFGFREPVCDQLGRRLDEVVSNAGDVLVARFDPVLVGKVLRLREVGTLLPCRRWESARGRGGRGLRDPSARWTAAGRFPVADISHDSAHSWFPEARRKVTPIGHTVILWRQTSLPRTKGTQFGTGTPTPDRTFGSSGPVVIDKPVNTGQVADSTVLELVSPIPP